jgi:hypothetical protein
MSPRHLACFNFEFEECQLCTPVSCQPSHSQVWPWTLFQLQSAPPLSAPFSAPRGDANSHSTFRCQFRISSLSIHQSPGLKQASPHTGILELVPILPSNWLPPLLTGGDSLLQGSVPTLFPRLIPRNCSRGFCLPHQPDLTGFQAPLAEPWPIQAALQLHILLYRIFERLWRYVCACVCVYRYFSCFQERPTPLPCTWLTPTFHLSQSVLHCYRKTPRAGYWDSFG